MSAEIKIANFFDQNNLHRYMWKLWPAHLDEEPDPWDFIESGQSDTMLQAKQDVEDRFDDIIRRVRQKSLDQDLPESARWRRVHGRSIWQGSDHGYQMKTSSSPDDRWSWHTWFKQFHWSGVSDSFEKAKERAEWSATSHQRISRSRADMEDLPEGLEPRQFMALMEQPYIEFPRDSDEYFDIGIERFYNKSRGLHDKLGLDDLLHRIFSGQTVTYTHGSVLQLSGKEERQAFKGELLSNPEFELVMRNANYDPTSIIDAAIAT
jgi:hypothetical protein